jgi:type II secretory pathway pseudopilin PulG
MKGFKMNRKNSEAGFTLLSVLVAAILASIIMWAITSTLTIAIKQSKKVQNNVNTALASVPQLQQAVIQCNQPRDKRVYVPVLNQCVQLEQSWYAKRTASRTVEFYQSSNCTTGLLGSLDATNNPTYDDTITNTFWNVSGQDSTLRILVRYLKF